MNKIKFAIFSLLGGSALFLKTCLTEERVLLNAEKNASKRIASTVAAEKAILTAKIESNSLIRSRLEKIKNIIDIVPFDNLYEIYNNENFIQKTNSEVLRKSHIPILRAALRKHYKNNDSFPEEQIKELITTGESQNYKLEIIPLHKIKIFLSNTYADQYLANYLERNSCNKQLVNLLEEYKVKRQLQDDGPLSKQVAFCKEQN